MVIDDATRKSFDKAKIGIIKQANSVFISSVLFSLRFRWTDEVPTAATNGSALMINPDFWNSLTYKEQVFLLLHEAWHVAFEHMVRLEDKNPMVWNFACDYVINAMLVDNDKITLPEGGLYEPGYRNWQAEDVYNELMAKPPLVPPENFMADLKAPDDSDGKEPAEEIKDIVIKASIRSKMGGDIAGTIPGEIQRWIDSILNPRLPWDVILSQYLSTLIPDDYTFRKCNRRFLPDTYMPTLQSDGLDKVLIAVDTSGSIKPEQLKQFATEAFHIIRALSPKQAYLCSWDWGIHDIEEINAPEDIMNYPFDGGGGTEVDAVIEEIQKTRYDVSIIFTDGHFSIDENNPGVPIVWATHSNTKFNPPYGRVIQYPLD